jgi:AcrR family transcriptional regulator
MSDAQNKNTEAIILDTARKVFVEKGFDGARMQEIADRAGINKALLHYYYRSKQKLFEAIFDESFQKIIPRILEFAVSSKPLAEKIDRFVSSYIDLLIADPHLPSFVLHELNRNPDRISGMVLKSGINLNLIKDQVDERMTNENYIKMDPHQLIVNMISLCIFPFVARPIIQTVLFDKDPEKFQKFIANRKKEVTRFILNAIKNY